MATSKEFHDYILFDVFAGIEGITSKKMMGEYILYTDGCIFGGLYDNRLLIKKMICRMNCLRIAVLFILMMVLGH